MNLELKNVIYIWSFCSTATTAGKGAGHRHTHWLEAHWRLTAPLNRKQSATVRPCGVYAWWYQVYTRVQLPDLFVTSGSNSCTTARQRKWPSTEHSNGQWKVCQLSNLMNVDGEIVSSLLLQDVCWPQLPPLGDVILAVELPYPAVEPVALIALFPVVLPVHQRLPPSWAGRVLIELQHNSICDKKKG